LHQFGEYGVWEIVQSTKYQEQSRNTGLYKVQSTRYKVEIRDCTKYQVPGTKYLKKCRLGSKMS
jgi:hypothetical protein